MSGAQYCLATPSTIELRQLTTSSCGKALLKRVTDSESLTVLSKGHQNILQSISEGIISVLIYACSAVSMLPYGITAYSLASTATLHDTILFDQIARHVYDVMQRALSFLDNHLITAASLLASELALSSITSMRSFAVPKATSRTVSVRPSFFAVSSVKRGTKERTPLAQWVPTQHHRHSRQLVLQQQVVGLIIKTPLANHQVGPAVLNRIDHRSKLLLFLLVKLFAILDTSNVQFVLCLGLMVQQDVWGFKSWHLSPLCGWEKSLSMPMSLMSTPALSSIRSHSRPSS